MKKHLLYAGMVLTMACTATAQNKDAVKFSKTINSETAYKHLSVLASDEYEGRETGTKGGWMAADYIKNYFKELGLKGPVSGDYFQPIDMVTTKLSQVLTINGQPAEAMKDFYIAPQSVGAEGFAFNANSIIFAGYGVNKEGYNDFEGKDITGKVVMILRTGEPNATRNNLAPKIKYLTEHKAAAILVIDPMVDAMPADLKNYLSSTQLTMKTKEEKQQAKVPQGTPVINVGTTAANLILAPGNVTLDALQKQLKSTGKPVTREIGVTVTASGKKDEAKVRAENVLGYLEGSDPKLKNEVLVVTAHYDHIGLVNDPEAKDKVNNGADDDGSGTTGVLMMAEAFSKAKKAGKGPKRSILFMTVTGEEKGLYGSEWYSENPVFPLENTIADLNIDMIGRGDKDHAADNNFVYIIGSDMLSTDLDRIGKKANKDYVNINLDERYNNRTDPNRFYYRSDHYNFAKHGIPVIFYFNGVHDDYHQPGDEVSKIDFPMLAKRAQLVYFTAWELANGATRPKVDKNDDGTPKN